MLLLNCFWSASAPASVFAENNIIKKKKKYHQQTIHIMSVYNLICMFIAKSDMANN